MIFVTGDCHGDYRKLSSAAFREQKEMDRQDFVIVCGDFGYWDRSRQEEYWMDWLAQKDFTLLFVDGNHENYDLLAEFPVQMWHGGKVQMIRENVIHLMRGQMFNLQGRRFFTFGGARSHDIVDGILEPDDPELRVKVKRLEGAGALFQEGGFKVGGEGTDLDLNVALREPAFRLGDLGFVGDQEAYGAVIGQLFEDAVYEGLGDDEHLLVF